MKLDLTTDEAAGLRQLLDAAVRAAGLDAARLAAPIDAKLRAAEAAEASAEGDAMAGKES